MVSIELIERISQRLNMPDAENIQAQANARFILYGVREDKSNFPRFNSRLTEKTHQQAFLCLEVACSFYDEGHFQEALVYFERAAELLEHNNATLDNEDYLANFNLMVGSLAFYCASQYSKSFILLKGRVYETPLGRLLYFFLSRQFIELEEQTKQILLSSEKKEYEAVYEILLARVMELTINYYYYGQKQYLEQSYETVNDAFKLALMDGDPAIWWLFRLVKILVAEINKTSLWSNIGQNPAFQVDDEGWKAVLAEIGIDNFPFFDNTAKLKLRQYINSLSFRAHPVTDLFISQRKALEKVLGIDGAVVSMPTSSGKTRIAELVILQTLLYNTSSKVLYIAPYRSLSYEMEETLSATFNPIGYYVTHLYGSAQYTALDRQEIDQARVVIVTPEKAKAILRANDEMIKQIRLVVMDEGHLLGQGQREVANEMFTEELRRIVKQNNGRFIVLSAVLPNAEDMSTWLANGDENVVRDTWRPSNQRFGKILLYKNRLDIEWNGTPKCFNPSFVKTEKDVDKKELIARAAQKLSSLGSILLYCPTTKQVLSNAKVMLGLLRDEEDIDWGNDPDWMRFQLVCRECKEDGIYLNLAKKGILCHSAALKSDVRRFTERLLRKGKARYVYATNTLAQGVNLGVSTVIVIGTLISRDIYLSNRDFWNMAGRAGRSYVDTEGKILFVCDCKDLDTKNRSIWLANKYMSSASIEKVESGIYHWLRKLKQLQFSLDIDFEYLLQIIAENNLNGLDDTSQFFELIDDSLLSLDLAYREDKKDDIEWVDEHFRHSIAVIQESEEKERKKNILLLKARVKAIRKITQVTPVPQAFASSGIPLNVAVYFENHADKLNALVDEYLQSNRDIAAKLFYIKQFDMFVTEIPTNRIQRYELNKLDGIRSNWIKGESLDEKLMSMAEKYYGYTFTWLMNALAAKNSLLEVKEYKEFYEEMSLIVQYGLPTKWAVQIYLSGISSRIVATELAGILEEPKDISRLSYTTTYLENQAERIQSSEVFSPFAKEWIKTMFIRSISKTTSIPIIHNFTINGKGTDEKYDKLLCKKYDGQPYLCSVDLKYHFPVKDSENLPFSEIVDIPGIFFSRKKTVWSMECHNPYVEVRD